MSTAPYCIEGFPLGKLPPPLQIARKAWQDCRHQSCENRIIHLLREVRLILRGDDWTPQDVYNALTALDAMEAHQLATPEIRELFPNLREVLWRYLFFEM